LEGKYILTSSRGSPFVLSVCGIETFFMIFRGMKEDTVAKDRRVIIRNYVEGFEFGWWVVWKGGRYVEECWEGSLGSCDGQVKSGAEWLVFQYLFVVGLRLRRRICSDIHDLIHLHLKEP
jgi:hypothetical protein